MVRKRTSQEEFLALFADELRNSVKTQEIYAALCNNRWEGESTRFDFSWRAAGEFIANLRNELDLPLDDPDICQRCGKRKKEHTREERESYMSLLLKEKTGESFKLSYFLCQEEGEETFYPGYLGPEDYMDYYCSGGEGQVAPWIEEKFTKAGFKHLEYDLQSKKS